MPSDPDFPLGPTIHDRADFGLITMTADQHSFVIKENKSPFLGHKRSLLSKIDYCIVLLVQKLYEYQFLWNSKHFLNLAMLINGQLSATDDLQVTIHGSNRTANLTKTYPVHFS